MAKKAKFVEKVEVNWNKEVTPDIIRGFHTGITDVVTRIEVTAKKNTYKFSNTGNLAARIYSGAEGQGSKINGKVWTETGRGTRNARSGRFQSTTNQGYALWVEIGTGIYGAKRRPIKPKRGKFLVWRDQKTGKLIFARQVRGRPATPFFRPAIEKHKTDVVDIMQDVLRKMP